MGEKKSERGKGEKVEEEKRRKRRRKRKSLEEKEKESEVRGADWSRFIRADLAPFAAIWRRASELVS